MSKAFTKEDDAGEVLVPRPRDWPAEIEVTGAWLVEESTFEPPPELERFIGEPLRLKSVVIDEDQVSVDLFRKDRGRHYFTYLLAADGGIKLWREDDSIMLDCNKPFAPGEAPFANLGDLVARALVAIGPMQDPYVTSAHVSRNFGCGRTEVVVYTEDERAKGRVVFDDRGRQREAEIQ